MKMEKEQEEIDAMIQELIRLYSDQDLLFGDGKLDWPVPGWSRISSYFGPRRHPVYGYKSTHTGIDIPASYGTAIRRPPADRYLAGGEMLMQLSPDRSRQGYERTSYHHSVCSLFIHVGG